MTIQNLALLTSIVAAVSQVISLSKSLSEVKLVTTIRILSLYILPILFIQQIIQFTYHNKTCFSFFLIEISLFIFLKYSISKPIGKIQGKDEWILFYSSLSSPFLFCFFQPIIFFARNFKYNELIETFIEQLSNYKINTEMFMFLSDNLFCALSLIMDAANLFLIFIILMKTLKLFEEYIFKDTKIDLRLDWALHKYAGYVFGTFLLSTGVLKFILMYVIDLF